MKNLQEAIKNIIYRTDKFPAESFHMVERHPEEAKPYLHAAIDRALADKEELDPNYMLHLYALFFAGEFHDQEAFEKIIALSCLPGDVLDNLIGDTVTEGLNNILYNTYNGNLELLKDCVRNPEVDDFVRGAMLDVMGQLYLDGILEEEELKAYLKELIYHEELLGDQIYTNLVGTICRCHFVDMLQEVQYLFDEELVDGFVYGEYDSCVDMMFRYDEWDSTFCSPSMSASEELKGWVMFEGEKNGRVVPDFEQIAKTLEEPVKKPAKKLKVGRNDPCPCGSGKKYKFCCMNKEKKDSQEKAQWIESKEEQKRWLKYYPETGVEKQEGRVYLEDYFDGESIVIDKLIYLALKHRAIPVWQAEEISRVQARKKAYLWEAFSKYIKKMKKEGIQTNSEYDKKYSIHYRCGEWLEELLALMEGSREYDRYEEVLKYYKK